MRPALDTLRTGSRTGARYLSPALVSSPAPAVRARLYGHPRAYLAATIATAFRGCSADPLAGQLHECALAAKDAVCDRLTLAEMRGLIRTANAARERTVALPRADRVPVLCAIVRELLTDAPSSCVALDIAVREACEKRHPTTDAHRAEAAKIIAEVCL